MKAWNFLRHAPFAMTGEAVLPFENFSLFFYSVIYCIVSELVIGLFWPKVYIIGQLRVS